MPILEGRDDGDEGLGPYHCREACDDEDDDHSMGSYYFTCRSSTFLSKKDVRGAKVHPTHKCLKGVHYRNYLGFRV